MMVYNVDEASLRPCSIFLFILFSICFFIAKGQENYRFRHLSTADGLSQSSVIAIAQDKNGLLWFGTRDGLNNYDGNQFTVYRNDPSDSTSISNNDILEILVDTKGDLWVGTYNGLNKYSYSEERFYRYFNEKGNPRSLSNNSVWAITQMNNGEIWIGTGGGLTIFKDGAIRQISHDPSDPASLSGNLVLEIFQDNAGDIWVGTSKGLNKAQLESDGQIAFERFQNNPADPNSINDNFVQSIVQGPTGNLWIGTRGGLHKLDPKTNRFVKFQYEDQNPASLSHNDIRSLSFDDKGQLWIGTYNGLNKMAREGTFTRILNNLNNDQSLSKNTIKSTFIDRKGSLWVGVYYGGINMLDETNTNFRNYKQFLAGNGLSYNVVSSIVEDEKGIIYIGTEGGGVDLLNPATSEIINIGSESERGKITSSNIKSLFLESGKKLWIGMLSTGIDVYDTEVGRFTDHFDKRTSLSHNSVYAILKENDSLFWVGTFGGGLNLLNIKDKSSRVLINDPASSESISDNQVRLLTKDKSGDLWVGTQYGLNLLKKENIEKGDFRFDRFFYNEQKKSGEDILVIFEDSQNRIWVGTYESGLSLYDRKAKRFVSYRLYNPSEGNSNVVHGILEDKEGNLWISSNQGITRFDPEQGTMLTFDESDGLVSNEFNNSACLKSSSGMMYFGGPDGLSAFIPDEIKMNNYAPKTVISELKIFNEPVRPVPGGILEKSITETEELTLDHDQAIFSLEFAIPNFINPDKNLYRYRLTGLEENWNITHKNTATYTIQKPGTYTFEVKGANNDEVWSDKTTKLKIKVLPAPWRTWWAFLIYFVLVSIALYVLTNIMLSRSKLRHELELEHLEHERQQSVNKMKLQFFTNISHEFRTPLTLILGPLEQIIQDYKGSNKMYKQLLVVEKNAIRLLKLINQLMDFRKFENKHEKLEAAEGNIVKFVEEIVLSFKHYAKIHHINYEFDNELENIIAWYDRDKMERVFYNLISNAFKYTEEHGTIRISVRKLADQVEFKVSDTGIGMDEVHLDKIFDRFYEIEDASVNQKHKHQKGTGIGLAITKGVMEMHSGKISAESEKGKGTTITVLLPLGHEHLREDQIIRDFKDSEDLSTYMKYNQQEIELEEIEQEMPLDAQENENAPLILVVEDNQQVRKFIVDIFKNDYRIEEAEDGKVGFKKAIQLVPDLIISDVMMPKMDGIELCIHTKSNLKTSHIPFILLTARTSLIFKFEGLESGADEYINKPFNIRELKLKAKNLLNIYTRLREKFTNESVVKPSEITVSSLDEKLLKKALEIVDENISNEFFNIQVFCSELGVSRTMLFTKIKAWTNLTPNEFIHSMRMKRAAQLLEQNKITVSQVSYKVGFQNPKYFSRCFHKYHSVTPSEYAEKFTVDAENTPNVN